MSTRKPEFLLSPGFWLDPDFFSRSVRLDLSTEVQRSLLSPEQQSAFVKYATEIAQIPTGGDEPIALQRDQIDKILSGSKRLKTGLSSLAKSTAATLATYSRDALFDRPPGLSVEMAERLAQMERTALLAEAWDWVSALEAICEHASSKLEPSRQTKPKQARARALVSDLAGFHWRLTGGFPPSDPAAWFAGFVDRLGEELDLEIGPRIVKSGIDDAKI